MRKPVNRHIHSVQSGLDFLEASLKIAKDTLDGRDQLDS